MARKRKGKASVKQRNDCFMDWLKAVRNTPHQTNMNMIKR